MACGSVFCDVVLARTRAERSCCWQCGAEGHSENPETLSMTPQPSQTATLTRAR